MFILWHYCITFLPFHQDQSEYVSLQFWISKWSRILNCCAQFKEKILPDRYFINLIHSQLLNAPAIRKSIHTTLIRMKWSKVVILVITTHSFFNAEHKKSKQSPPKKTKIKNRKFSLLLYHRNVVKLLSHWK